MNVPLLQVLTASTGIPGLASIRAIVAGERDPVPLARFRAPRWAHSTEDIAKALTGVDVVAIPGLHASTVHTMIAEIGLDMGKWPTEKAFCAWRGLAPRHEISGGKVLRRSPLKTRNRAGQALR
jgi:transposase